MSEELIAIHVDARAELLERPFYSAARFAERLDAYLTIPAFELVTGRVGGVLIGYAFGSTLPADTRWWQELTGATDPDMVRETYLQPFVDSPRLPAFTSGRKGGFVLV